jgi:hypothetical protein
MVLENVPGLQSVQNELPVDCWRKVNLPISQREHEELPLKEE